MPDGSARLARLIPLPDSLDLRRASLAEPAGIAWHALDRAEAVGTAIAGAHVLVVGGGPIGLLVAAVARYRGAASVTVADVRISQLPLHGIERMRPWRGKETLDLKRIARRCRVRGCVERSFVHQTFLLCCTGGAGGHRAVDRGSSIVALCSDGKDCARTARSAC